MSKIKTKVLTTTNQQDLSGVQAQNARTNIGAQVKLTTDDESAIILTDIHEDDDPSKPIVAQRIDANVSAYHSGDDGKYITVDNTKNEIDLSESAKRKIGTKSDWTAPAGTDGEILHKPFIPAKANNGKLTINYINREGEKITKVFYADSAEDIVLNISDTDTTYEPATKYKDGLLSASDKAKLTTLTKPNDGKLTIRFTNANGTVKQTSFSADASSDTIVDITDTNTTYENATLTADGLMSKEDKAKLENVIAPNDGKLLLRFIKADGTIEEKDFSANSDKNVVFTVTAYPCDIATPEKDGLMSKEDKEKLDSITDNMQSDWAEESELSSSYIKNKPSIYTQSVIDEKFAAVDSKLHARAKFGYATVDELPEEGDSASMYYVGPKAGVTPDAYDVYEWNATTMQYVMVDSASIKLDGYWHGAPTVEGSGNAITGITFDGANVVINKDTTFATESDLSAHIEDKDIHVTLDDKNKWDSYKPNDGTLVVKLAGATFDASFNANSATDVIIDIPLGTTMEPGLFSTADNVKLTEIEAGAEVNVQSDWDIADTASKAYIKNKPAINDGTFHLSLGGVTCDESFSANSSTDVTIDIPLGSTMEPGLISIDDKAKLDKIPEDAEKNVQSDWNEINDESDAYIKNKPVINDGIMHLSLAGVTCDTSFSANAASDVTIDIPLGTTMEPGLFSTVDNIKLSEIEAGAEVNVQVDWNETDTARDSYILNKPAINDGVMHLSLAGVTCDTSFSANAVDDVTIDIPLGTTMEPGLFSTADNIKLYGIDEGAQVNVQSDWDETDSAKDEFIKNKPAINDGTMHLSLAGVTCDTSFSANAASDVTIDIPLGTTMEPGLFSAADNRKLFGIEDGAQVNVKADWNEDNEESDSFIQNKPAINDGIMHLSLAGVTCETSFSANSETDVTIDIPLGTTMEPGLFSTSDNAKLYGIDEGAQVNVQSDWDETDNSKDSFIQNKPSINDGIMHLSLAGVTCEASFSANADNDVTFDIPLGTTMEPGLFSTADNLKLHGIASGAQVNVKADWNENNEDNDSFIQNKPAINDGTMHLSLAGVTCDESFSANSASDVTIDIPLGTTMEPGLFSTADNMKLTGIEAGAEVNVRSDWNETDATNDSYILNKPAINDGVLHLSLAGVTCDTSFSANAANDVTIDIPLGTTMEPGLFSATDKIKLDNIECIYECVDEMKADLTLNDGDIVQTKRFYSLAQSVFVDDEFGGCTYRIMSTLSGTDSDGIGMDIIELSNGKYAKAQLFNEAKPEQLGYQLKYGPVNGVDLTPYIQRMTQIGITTIRLNRTGHIGSSDTAHAVYRIKDMCTLDRSVKIIGVHDSASGYSTRVYLTPSTDNTEHVMFDCKVRMIEIKDLILMNVQNDRYDKSVCIRISAGTEGKTSSAGCQFERLNIQGFKYGIYGSSGFYWHDSFIHLNMANNYVNVRLERLAYTTKFYNCLFNIPKYRSIEVGSPFTLEFDTCNFGVDGDCDTLLYVERWDSEAEVPRVNERYGMINFVNSQMEYENHDKPIAKNNHHVFIYIEDNAITKINCKHCAFIITPFARAQEYSCRWFSLGPNGYMNLIDSLGPLNDVDIQPGTAGANYFLEKDFDKMAFDESRPCRKTVNAIHIENSFGFSTSLIPDSHISAVQTDGNMILTTNGTDMSEYYKTPQGTQFLNLDTRQFQTYASDKMVNINTIPGNFIRIGDELYEYVIIDGLKWINRNLNLRTPNKQCTYWNHLNFGQYYNTSDIVNIESRLPEGWRIPTDADIASLVADGSADRVRSLQSTAYQTGWPNATNSTGFSMTPSLYWKRPSQASESNFNRGFIFGQAVSAGRRNIDFKESSINLGGWGTSDLTNLYVPVRVCADDDGSR